MSWNPVVAAVVLKCLKLQQCICVDPSCRLSASCDDCCGGDHAWVQRNWTFTLHLPTSKCGNVCPSWSLGSTKKEVQYLTGCLLAYQKIYLTKSSFFHISLHILLSSCKMPPKNHYPNKTRNGSPVLKKNKWLGEIWTTSISLKRFKATSHWLHFLGSSHDEIQFVGDISSMEKALKMGASWKLEAGIFDDFKDLF